MEKFEKVPDQEDLHLQPAGVRLPRPAAEQAPRADALRAEERQGQQPGQAPLQFGKVRIFIRTDGAKARPRSSARTGASSRRMDDEMRLYLGVAQDIVVKRTIDKNETAARRRQPLQPAKSIVKYEIENFKDTGRSRWTSSENLRHIRNEVARRHRPRRRVGTGQRDDASRAAGQGKEHLRPAGVPRQAAGPRRRRQGRRRSSTSCT